MSFARGKARAGSIAAAALAVAVLAGCSASPTVAGSGDNPGGGAEPDAQASEQVTEEVVEDGAGETCTLLFAAPDIVAWGSAAVPVDPAAYTSAVGVPLPSAPDCGVTITYNDGSKGTQLIWENGDVAALGAALVAAGYEETAWSDENGVKNMYTGPAGLGWVHSGRWIVSDASLESAMLTFPGS